MMMRACDVRCTTRWRRAPAVGADIASTGEYIQQTVMRTFKSFGDAFELQETIGNCEEKGEWRELCERVSE